MADMDVKTFKSLDIQEQIKYLNGRLSEGHTVIRIREDLGIPEKWLQGHIKTNGYKFDRNEKIYKHSTDVETTSNDANGKSGDIIDATNDVETKFYNSREVVVDKEQFNLMLKSYKEVEKMASKLDAVYKWYEKEHEVIDVTPHELKIDKFEGEATSRAYKFYPDIQNNFIKFCDKHKQYKKQDIICQALKEFMEKYK